MIKSILIIVYYYHRLLEVINGLCTENRPRTLRTPTPYKIKANNCKLRDLVIRIELATEILVTRFSNFLRNSTIHFCMFLYFETCFLWVKASLLCRLQGVSKIYVSIYPSLITLRKKRGTSRLSAACTESTCLYNFPFSMFWINRV